MKHDGTGKNDCERNAASALWSTCVTTTRIRFIVTEDSLSSNAPHIETLHAYGLRYILGVKEGDHTVLFQHVQAAEHAGHVTYYERVRPHRAGGARLALSMMSSQCLQLRRAVNFIEYWEMGQDKVQHFSWVTDIRVSKRNVYHLMRGTSSVEDRKRDLQYAENQAITKHNYAAASSISRWCLPC